MENVTFVPWISGTFVSPLRNTADRNTQWNGNP